MEYKTKCDWKLSKKLKFHNPKKWYMHKPEGNEILKNSRNFVIQMDHPVEAKRPDLILNDF